MKFIPNSKIKKDMLKTIGMKRIDDLFSDISKEIRIDDLDLPNGLSQLETSEKLRKLSKKNRSAIDDLFFIGGGIKPHYIPSVVKYLISRGEFLTSYTPYQSEASQGFLQAMFEFQSIIAEITGMDVANCSLYDGVTALSEAALMCSRITKKYRFIIPNNISWEKKSVLRNYCTGPGIKIDEVSYEERSGQIDIEMLKDLISDKTSGIYIENPNYFGIFEEQISKISEIAKNLGVLFVLGVDPISLGIIKPPGEYGADIVVGEGRALGNAIDYGGSSLGIFSCKKEYLRQMPGRVIGLTKDLNGKNAFCLTFQTREQHIRRGKATSNICTNEGLNALAAVIYLSLLGGKGFYELSKSNFENGQKLAKSITSIDGFKKRFKGVHFNEFVVECPKKPDLINKRLLAKGIHGGMKLDKQFSNLSNCLLFGITELYDDCQINRLKSVLEEDF